MKLQNSNHRILIYLRLNMAPSNKASCFQNNLKLALYAAVRTACEEKKLQRYSTSALLAVCLKQIHVVNMKRIKYKIKTWIWPAELSSLRSAVAPHICSGNWRIILKGMFYEQIFLILISQTLDICIGVTLISCINRLLKLEANRDGSVNNISSSRANSWL